MGGDKELLRKGEERGEWGRIQGAGGGGREDDTEGYK